MITIIIKIVTGGPTNGVAPIIINYINNFKIIKKNCEKYYTLATSLRTSN